MKRTVTFSSLLIFLIIFSNSSVLKDSSGRAGATGAPGETTCAGGGCHSGGTSATKGVTLTSSPSFSLNQYYPDSVYTITLTVEAIGFTRFGIGCEVLNSNSVNSGTISTPGTGAKIINTARKNLTHNTPKIAANNQATFTFKWNAPAAGDGEARFFVCANAVNGNGNTAGDMPIPFSYTVTEGAVPTVTTTVGIIENKQNLIRNCVLFPNPANSISNLSYYLTSNQIVSVDLYDLNGKHTTNLYTENELAGEQTHVLNLQNVPKGAYFLRVSANKNKLTQKLLVVN